MKRKFVSHASSQSSKGDGNYVLDIAHQNKKQKKKRKRKKKRKTKKLKEHQRGGAQFKAVKK